MDRDQTSVTNEPKRPGRGRLKRLGAQILNHIYPPNCVHCDVAIGIADNLCPGCWSKLRPITAPLCPRLGLPFEVSIGAGALSAEAIANPPPFNRARSAVLHNDVARRIISRLKFGDRPELAKFCARLMVSAGAELFEGGDDTNGLVLVPVPLHRTRQWQRRYNQSNELAKEMARLGGFDVEPLLVRRKRSTSRQIGLSAQQRVRNVAGAFEADANAFEITKGRRVVIVDDVITTGSTVSAVTRALKKSGIAHIDVISFSRVVIGDHATI